MNVRSRQTVNDCFEKLLFIIAFLYYVHVYFYTWIPLKRGAERVSLGVFVCMGVCEKSRILHSSDLISDMFTLFFWLKPSDIYLLMHGSFKDQNEGAFVSHLCTCQKC